MIRFFLFASLFFATFSINAQNLEISSGVNHNKLYELLDKGDAYLSSTPKLGFTSDLSIEDIKFGRRKWRFSVGIEQYQSKLYVHDSNKSYREHFNGSFQRTNITFGIFPFNEKILKKIDLNFGARFGYILQEKYHGEHVIPYLYPDGKVTENFSEKFPSFSEKLAYGVEGRLAYDIQLSNTLILSPQYSFYLGLAHETRKLPKDARSVRHMVGIGLQKSL